MKNGQVVTTSELQNDNWIPKDTVGNLTVWNKGHEVILVKKMQVISRFFIFPPKVQEVVSGHSGVREHHDCH